MKTILLTLIWTDWYRSHERAFVRVVSPTGNSLDIRKARYNRFTDKQKAVWTKLVNHYNEPTIELTIDDMAELLAMS